MPKIVKVRNYNPPNLLSEFSSNDISSAAGNDLGSTTKYSYNASSDLRLWIRFEPGAPVDLVNYDPNDKPTIEYEGTEDTQEMTVYSNRMKSARFSDDGNKNALLTFPGGAGNSNIISFGDGFSEDLPFSVSFWFRKIPDVSSDLSDYFFSKAKDNITMEYLAYYNPSNNRIYFQLHGAGSNNNIYQGIYATVAEIADENWHHFAFTYDGRGTTDGATPTAGMKIYVDGISQSTTVDSLGVYTYMDNVSEELAIGANRAGAYEADGDMTEFAIWAKELSIEEIKAIYNWTREDSIVKSGYTNLPPRIRLRDIDNRPGCYPTKHRMGDKDRSGKANIFYEDLPVQFGNEIKDDFTNVPNTDLITTDTGFDQKKWVVSSGMTIRREAIQGSEGIIIDDRCATFSGAGTGGKRYLRSSQKIRNPYRFYFELIEGPYQFSPILLALSAGDADETLKLEIATDAAFTSPVTIATYIPSSNPNENYKLVGKDKKPRRVVSLSTSDFPDLGQEYYFRFVQETFTNNKNVWSLANIEVEYANQNIRYPLLLDHSDNAGNKIANSILGNANISGSLTATGRSVKGVSDLGNPFQDFSETISAFNETLTVENADDEFFNQGLDPDIYPGFTSPARSKTKFTIDLSPSEATTFGYMDKLSNSYSTVASDTSGIGQRLMVYWNNDLKRWEKIGKQLHHGNIVQSSPAEHIAIFQHALTSSCLGFGPLTRTIFSGDDANNLTFLNKSYLAQSYKKTDLYTFPFGPQYFGTSSFTIKAKDIGITKPFLLEKTSIEFDATFNFSKDFQSFQRLYQFTHHDTDSGNPSTISPLVSVGAVTPTFFMLRQFNDSFHYNAKETTDRSYGTIPIDFKVPDNYAITQGSDSLTYVDKNRELITYKNLQLLLSQSDANQATSATRPDGSYFSIDDFINNGLKGDANETYFYTEPGSDPIPSLTRRFIINSNVKMRTISTDKLSSIRILDDTGQTGLFTRNRTGKSNSQLKSSRSIVNGFSSLLRTSDGTAPGFGASAAVKTFRLPSLEEIEKQHLYLILPSDDLIFGWQYPAGINPTNGSPGSDTTDFNTMQLFGNSKLHLYGSEVVENKEYHETVNQNLTSCAVYEHIIGDEKIVDQWQIAYRGELTGSIIGQTNFGAPGMSMHVPLSTTYTYAYSPDFVTNNLSDFVNNESTAYRVNNLDDSRKGGPVPRIGLFTFTPSKGLQSFDDIPGISTANARIYYSFAKSSEKHLRFRDQDRIYEDSKVSVGNYYDDSSYGTLIRTHDLADTSQNIFKDLRPKYRFNYRHFGYYSDMLSQGKDSNFKSIPRQGFTTGFDIVVNSQSPIKIEFVSGSYSDTPDIKTYVKKDVESYLDEFNFQSSNLSTAATSSMPFIDDNQPRNRSYIEQEYIAVPIF